VPSGRVSRVSERPTGLQTVLLTLRFVAEIGMLVALAWGGWHLVDSPAASIVVAVVLPLLAAGVWARWIAPRSTHRLPDPGRAAVEVVLFLGAFVVLTQSDPHPRTVGWGLALLAAYALSMPARRVEV
jgi:Protein of unknown function (DUF2568)